MKIVELTVPTTKADNRGTWFYLPESENKILVAVNVNNKVKPGTLFGPDLKAMRSRKGKQVHLWQSADNVYRARRMQMYIHAWVKMQLGLVRDLNQLALLSLAATYGDVFTKYDELVALSKKLQPLLTDDENGLLGTNNQQVRKARDLIRTTKKRDGPSSRKRLGYTAAAIRTAQRGAELDMDQRIVVSLSTVVDRYIGTVIEQVKGLLPELEQKLSLVWQEAFKPAVRDYFALLAATMKDLFVVRPFVDPGVHCIRDAEEVARVIDSLMPESRGHRSGAMEFLRQLMKNIIDCFKLLLWQYEHEMVLTWVAELERQKKGMTREEGDELLRQVKVLQSMLPEHLGSGFKNNVLSKILVQLDNVVRFIEAGTQDTSLLAHELSLIKNCLTTASDCVGSNPPKNE